MVPEDLAGLQTRLPNTAKSYNRTKLLTGIFSSLLSLAFLWALVNTGWSRAIERLVAVAPLHAYVTLLLFTLVVGLLETALTLPFGYYSGYYLEHRYALSNQTFTGWAWERLKGALVALPIAVCVILFLYFCLTKYGNDWWIPVGAGLTLLSVILARVAPIVIMPLFYTFTPLPENSLKERIEGLCRRTGIRFAGVFSFNLSKNTRKANAGITGIGKAKRIILGDTLLKEFSEEEIETVFAHELGHYLHHHILIGIAVGIVSTFAGLFVASLLYAWSIVALGFASPHDIAALPLLAIWLSLFGLVTGPIGNIISRRHERQADAFAVAETGNGAAFASALRKLASMNLADPEPHPVVEFLFHSHPSISRRIRDVEAAARAA